MTFGRTPSRARGEDGVSLILAMAFLGLLGVLVVSLLGVTYGSFKTTIAVRDNNSSLFGADGGADIAVQLLRDSNAYCPDVSASPQSMPSQTVGGRTVSLTCQALSGSVGGGGSGLTPYALIATAYPNPNGQNADINKTLEFGGSSTFNGDMTTLTGDVFMAGYMIIKDSPPGFRIVGNLNQYNPVGAPFCDKNKFQPADASPVVTGTWACVNAPAFPVPDPVPTLKAPTATAPSSITSGNCTVFFPGRYTSAPSFNKDKQYYFASGVYYWDNVDKLELQGQVFGGQPDPSDTQRITTATPCSNDSAANAMRPGTATGYGVQFILGDKTQIKIKDDTKHKIELFSRVPANASLEGTAGVTVYAPRTDGTNWKANVHDKVLEMDGAKPNVVFHGLWYSPAGFINAAYALDNDEAGNAPMFGTGVVASTFKVTFKSGSENAKFAAASPSTPATTRTTVVTATATDPAGGAPITVKAVIQLGTSAGTPATILSWRKA